MTIRDELRKATGRELAERLAAGHPLDAESIAGFVYRGTSLGLSRWMEALSWVSFQKVFMRDDASGRVMGWNVRLEQTGLHGPSQPKKDRRGEPVRFGAYEVYPMGNVRAPRPVPPGALLIDYSRAKAHLLDPLAFVVDPLVALEPGNPELLLGWSYVALGGGISTPSYFLLEREKPLDHAPPKAVGRALARERAAAPALQASA
jgi:hypothetical protein